MDVYSLFIIAVAGFLSAMVKNSVAVGAGIFLLPICSLVLPAKVALGIGAPIMLASDVIALRYYWKQWVFSAELWRLMVPSALGLLLGVWMIPIIPGPAFRTAVGIFGMLYALGMFFSTSAPVRMLERVTNAVMQHRRESAVVFGLAGGIASVLAHAGGIVWSMYLMTAHHDRRAFVGTLVLIFALTNLYKTVTYMYIGILPLDLFLYVLASTPAIMLGSWLGNVMNKKMSSTLFMRAVLLMIFCASAALL